jgi:Galactoside-binding lectin
VFVGPGRLAGAAEMIRARHVVAPLATAHDDVDRIVDEIEASPWDIAVLSAGRGAKIVEARIARADKTVIDTGSAFDPLFVGPTRTLQIDSRAARSYFRHLLPRSERRGARWLRMRESQSSWAREPRAGTIRFYPDGLRPPERIKLLGRHPFTTDSDGAIRWERFAIDWVDASGDILLHVNPRPTDGVVVLNSCAGGEWQEELVVEGYPFVLEPDVPLTLAFEVLTDEFRVASGRRQLCVFPHRAPPSTIIEVRSSTPVYDVGDGRPRLERFVRTFRGTPSSSR